MSNRESGVLPRGVIGAYVATADIRSLLFGVEPHDPTTFIGVGAMMAAIVIIACWIPRCVRGESTRRSPCVRNDVAG